MEPYMTRRSFGALFLASAALPSFAFAGSGGYAFPALLESVEGLLSRAWLGHDSRPHYERSGMILIDVRERAEYDQGHIPGARHLDPNAVVAGASPVTGALRPEAEIAGLLAEIGIAPSLRVVFYDDRGGFHAARMFWLLEYFGHQNVALLNGGFSAWRAAGGPVETETADFQPAAITPAPMARRFASADYILAHREDPDTVVIDVRPPKLYEEGHIPWALNIPWSQNLGEDGLFLSAAALRAHFEAHGVIPERNIVIHCQTGLASSHSYVALRLLGYPRLRVYHRSWAEWGSDMTLPRETGS